jgi:L-ascorbate metabolism protein UlaG (beta-lactamase superfamily)
MGMKELKYHGHSAVLITYNDTVIAFDPWLVNNPACPESLKHPENVDLIILTHGHSDHASEAPELAQRTGAEIVATYELCNIMVSEGVDGSKIHYMNKGGTVKWKGLSISLTDAKHSSSYDLPSGPVYAGEACGVVIHDGTTSLYHAGDTLFFRDMETIRELYKPDLALLPIGDRFTMGPAEAARAAHTLGVKRAIPIHYATFELLTGTAEEFVTACQGSEVEPVILAPGEALSL